MNKITDILNEVHTVGVAGHVKPDGDCVGSTMGFYHYLLDNYPDIHTDVYLEQPSDVFHYIKDIDKIKTTADENTVYDLFIIMDVSSIERIGVADKIIKNAKHTVCIDHHATNNGLAEINHIFPEIGSTCEVLYKLFDPKKVGLACAEAIYTGMIHDTGVFQYTNTSPDTLRIAADLLEKGVKFNEIIEGSFSQKTYRQNQILGRTLLESILMLDGKCIVGLVTKRQMEFYGVTPVDLDGIVSQLNNTAEAKVAVFIYERDTQEYKVSLRAKGDIDVCKVAAFFGGGGHKKAAGCTLYGTSYDVITNIAGQLEKVLN